MEDHLIPLWTSRRSQRLDLSRAITHIGARDFAPALGKALHSAFGASHVAVYSWRDSRAILNIAQSTNVTPIGTECWEIYISEVIARDLLWENLKSLLDANVNVVGFVRPRELSCEQQRISFYRHHRLQSRLSSYSRLSDGTILACNLYRTTGEADFDESMLAAWREFAPTVQAIVGRHIEITDSPAHDEPESEIARRLDFVYPDLSSRERQVIALALVGRSYKEIGRTLDISAATAKTYRERGFSRMKVSSMYEAHRAILQGG